MLLRSEPSLPTSESSGYQSRKCYFLGLGLGKDCTSQITQFSVLPQFSLQGYNYVCVCTWSATQRILSYGEGRTDPVSGTRCSTSQNLPKLKNVICTCNIMLCNNVPRGVSVSLFFTFILQNHVWQYLEKKQHSAIFHIVYVTVQASHNTHHLQYEVHTPSASKLTTHTVSTLTCSMKYTHLLQASSLLTQYEPSLAV